MSVPGTAASKAAEVAASPATLSAASSLLEMLGSLILVLLLIFALAWLARWMQGARMGRGLSMQLQAGIQVGHKERVVLLAVGGKQFLVGVASGGVTLLHRFDEPIDVPSGTGLSASPFAEKLRQAVAGKPSSGEAS